MTQKQTYRYREWACGCQGGEGREGLEVWDWQMQTVIYRMDNKVLDTGTYIQYLVVNRNANEYEKNIYTYN